MTDKFIITKERIYGQVELSGAKNSALKLLSSSLLCSEKIELDNFPNNLEDVKIHNEMLSLLGKRILVENNLITITEQFTYTALKWTKRSIRNTLLIMGALVSRFGNAKIPLPGGCNLGERKYDLHVMILEKLGARVWQEGKYLFSEAKDGLTGCDLYLPIRSTGATENAIICATLARGKTTIWNPHIRPEVIELVEFINKMGGQIKVFGQQKIEIIGVEVLHGCKFKVMPDNMEALTWAIASVITNGEIEIFHFPFEHLEVPLIFLRESGMKFYKGTNSIIVKGGIPYPLEISTGPYPGINSDMQPLFAAYGASAKGKTKIIDLRFPGRYDYATEMSKMGVRSNVIEGMLTIEGGNRLNGNIVKAVDLRAGISLLLCGLIAEGETIIQDAWQIERGYENIEHKLINLGVKNFKVVRN